MYHHVAQIETYILLLSCTRKCRLNDFLMATRNARINRIAVELYLLAAFCLQNIITYQVFNSLCYVMLMYAVTYRKAVLVFLYFYCIFTVQYYCAGYWVMDDVCLYCSVNKNRIRANRFVKDSLLRLLMLLCYSFVKF